MNKAELIDKVAKDAGITKQAAALAVDSLVNGMALALAENERVTLSGFGTWTVSEHKARQGRNPQTGEEIDINARRAVRFRTGKDLHESLNS
jgi:DNA-binding protein HU-beta